MLEQDQYAALHWIASFFLTAISLEGLPSKFPFLHRSHFEELVPLALARFQGFEHACAVVRDLEARLKPKNEAEDGLNVDNIPKQQSRSKGKRLRVSISRILNQRHSESIQDSLKPRQEELTSFRDHRRSR